MLGGKLIGTGETVSSTALRGYLALGLSFSTVALRTFGCRVLLDDLVLGASPYKSHGKPALAPHPILLQQIDAGACLVD